MHSLCSLPLHRSTETLTFLPEESKRPKIDYAEIGINVFGTLTEETHERAKGGLEVKTKRSNKQRVHKRLGHRTRRASRNLC